MLEYFVVICVSYIFIFALIFVLIGAGGINKPKQYICKNCGKVFDRAQRLTKHLEKCIAAQNYICDQCDKICHKKDRLIKHMKKHNQTHECDICGKFFEKANTLIKHKERANIFSCDGHCARRFCSRDALQIHQRSTQQQRQQPT